MSVNETPVIGVGFELSRVTVMFEAPPGDTDLGLKDLVQVGEVTTVSVAVPAVPVPALAVETVPVEFK